MNDIATLKNDREVSLDKDEVFPDPSAEAIEWLKAWAAQRQKEEEEWDDSCLSE